MSIHPVTLPSYSFESKKAATKYFKTMRRSYKSGETISQQHSDFLLELLQYHPEAQTKIGVGVKRFYVDKCVHGTTPFYIERLDGTYVHFSAKKCIDGAAERA